MKLAAEKYSLHCNPQLHASLQVLLEVVNYTQNMGNQLVNSCYYGTDCQSIDELKQYEIDNSTEL